MIPELPPYADPSTSSATLYAWSEHNQRHFVQLLTCLRQASAAPHSIAASLWLFNVELHDWHKTISPAHYRAWQQQIPHRHWQEINTLSQPTLLDYLFISAIPNAGSLADHAILYYLLRSHWLDVIAAAPVVDAASAPWSAPLQQISEMVLWPRRHILQFMALDPSPSASFDAQLVRTLKRLPIAINPADLQSIRQLIGAPRDFMQLLDRPDLSLRVSDLPKITRLITLYPSYLSRSDLAELLSNPVYLAQPAAVWHSLTQTLIIRHKRLAHRKADFMDLSQLLAACLQQHNQSAASSTGLRATLRHWLAPLRASPSARDLEDIHYTNAVAASNLGILNYPLPAARWAGSRDIIPITNSWEIHHEGDVMKHCIASYIPIIQSGSHSAYRMLYPERCTVLLRNTDSPQIEDIRVIHDVYPSAETVRYLMHALDQFSHTPTPPWTPDRLNQQLIFDSKHSDDLHLGNGIRKVDKIYSNGKDGFLFYGPYMPLAAGHYTLSLRGEIYSTSEPDSIVLDVTADNGATQVITQQLRCTPGEFEVQLSFSLAHPKDHCEIRTRTKNRSWLMVSSIQLHKHLCAEPQPRPFRWTTPLVI